MYCKECGQKYENESANVCLNCGVKKGNGKNYCDDCGEERKSVSQDVCLNCGKDLKKIFLSMNNQKTKLVTLLLCLFLGAFGAHHFYVGNTKKGIIYIGLTLGGIISFGITPIIAFILMILDLIKILTDKFEDSNSNVITQWT